jgi:hypothetical protein
LFRIVKETGAAKITGKFRGNFLISSGKSRFMPKFRNFCFWNRELTGNFQIGPQVVEVEGFNRRTMDQCDLNREFSREFRPECLDVRFSSGLIALQTSDRQDH